MAWVLTDLKAFNFGYTGLAASWKAVLELIILEK
jgi:hypothetical protein